MKLDKPTKALFSFVKVLLVAGTALTAATNVVSCERQTRADACFRNSDRCQL